MKYVELIVKDRSGEVLPGASVEVKSAVYPSYLRAADNFGAVSVNLNYGETITVTHTGYIALSVAYDKLQPGINVILLDKSVETLPDIIITASKNSAWLIWAGAALFAYLIFKTKK